MDKTAIITSGDSGIGRTVAIAFAREGADIMISPLNEDEDEEVTAACKVQTIAGDIGEEQHLSRNHRNRLP